MKIDKERLIARRVSRGFNEQESRELLEFLIGHFAPKNLPAALSYQEFTR